MCNEGALFKPLWLYNTFTPIFKPNPSPWTLFRPISYNLCVVRTTFRSSAIVFCYRSTNVSYHYNCAILLLFHKVREDDKDDTALSAECFNFLVYCSWLGGTKNNSYQPSAVTSTWHCMALHCYTLHPARRTKSFLLLRIGKVSTKQMFRGQGRPFNLDWEAASLRAGVSWVQCRLDVEPLSSLWSKSHLSLDEGTYKQCMKSNTHHISSIQQQQQFPWLDWSIITFTFNFR